MLSVIVAHLEPAAVVSIVVVAVRSGPRGIVLLLAGIVALKTSDEKRREAALKIIHKLRPRRSRWRRS